MVVARRRRRRRPVLPALALVITLAVLIGAALSGSDEGGPDRRLTYVDEVAPIVQRSSDLGADLAGLREQATTLSRSVLEQRMDRLAREARSMLRAAQQAEPPEELDSTHSLLVATLAVRSAAVGKLGPALDQALRGDPQAPAVEGLSQVGADLLVADRTYQLFLESLPAEARRAAPESTWISDAQSWQPLELATLVATLRSSASLGPVHDVAVVTVATDPPPAGTEGAVNVLPVVTRLAMDVVVANVGNEAEKQVPVVATLTNAAGGVDTARQFADLDPGQRMTVRLGGLIPQGPGPWTLSVKAGPVGGESGVADNENVRTFTMR